MRSVFVYEFITGGGCWTLGGEPPSGSLLAEGAAMRDALLADIAAVSSIEEIHLLHDVRLPQLTLPTPTGQFWHRVNNAREELQQLTAIAELVDGVIIIAPEFSQLLAQRVELLESLGSRVLSPNSEWVRLCSDKHRTCEHLTQHGVRAPRGLSFLQLRSSHLSSDLFPAVLKPNDGAGSQFVQLLGSPAEIRDCELSAAGSWRLEKYHPGLPVSVSLLAGPRGFIALQPCTQHLSDDARFTYRGGVTPLPSQLAARAKTLALAAAATLPLTKGYLGIDMVLGSAENGSQDVVIEINPRLTTSYLGLRQACEQNLAEAMLKWAAGEPVELSWRPQTFEFAVPADP